MYEYKARVTRVVDGDTFDAEVDLGFRMHTRQRFRLLGYNAPEKRGPERDIGKLAAQELESLLRGEEITIRTEKGDAFGRWLATVLLEGVWDLVEVLIEEGWGVAWDGKGKRPGFDPSAPYPLNPERPESEGTA